MSLPAEDVEFLDAYASAEGYASRSAVVHKAVRFLQGAELAAAYEAACAEWQTTGDAADWELTSADGLGADAAG